LLLRLVQPVPVLGSGGGLCRYHGGMGRKRNLPPLHELEFIQPTALMCATEIAKRFKLKHYNVRSWSTGRRTSKKYGPMPPPIGIVANRPVWLYGDIIKWLGR